MSDHKQRGANNLDQCCTLSNSRALAYQSSFNVKGKAEEVPIKMRYQFAMEKNELLAAQIKSLEKIIKNQNKSLDNAESSIKEKDGQLFKLQSELIEAYKSQMKK